MNHLIQTTQNPPLHSLQHHSLLSHTTLALLPPLPAKLFEQPLPSTAQHSINFLSKAPLSKIYSHPSIMVPEPRNTPQFPPNTPFNNDIIQSSIISAPIPQVNSITRPLHPLIEVPILISHPEEPITTAPNSIPTQAPASSTLPALVLAPVMVSPATVVKLAPPAASRPAPAPRMTPPTASASKNQHESVDDIPMVTRVTRQSTRRAIIAAAAAESQATPQRSLTRTSARTQEASHIDSDEDVDVNDTSTRHETRKRHTQTLDLGHDVDYSDERSVRRAKNKLAARKSRENKKVLAQQQSAQFRSLEEENQRLSKEFAAIKEQLRLANAQIASLNALLGKKGDGYSHTPPSRRTGKVATPTAEQLSHTSPEQRSPQGVATQAPVKPAQNQPTNSGTPNTIVPINPLPQMRPSVVAQVPQVPQLLLPQAQPYPQSQMNGNAFSGSQQQQKSMFFAQSAIGLPQRNILSPQHF